MRLSMYTHTHERLLNIIMIIVYSEKMPGQKSDSESIFFVIWWLNAYFFLK